MPKETKRHTLHFAEQFFPARTEKLLAKAAELASKELPVPKGKPHSKNKNYVKWLQNESMLHDAHRLARKYSGQSHMWHNPYARPRPRFAVKQASVWYTAYPISLITKKDDSIINALADPALWEAFQSIGIKGMHTGPMKRAGGVNGWELTPSIDGHFDRISTKIDPLFGTERDFKHLVKIAAEHDAIIIDDIVPGHTGKGADFRLAEMNHQDYPGIYHMIEIQPNDWGLLPAVPNGKDSVNLDHETEAELKRRGYIIGKLPRVIFYEPGVKETNWSVTREVVGTDGISRRWVYLHYFKDGQPSLNWLDPSFAGMKLVIGDALHSLGELGSGGLRLDANGFLGIEVGDADEPAWSEGHPLSEAANHLIASMVRKLGGFTFQELNLSMDDIKTMSQSGADLSYDFVNRPAYQHAISTGDTEFLQLTLRSALAMGIDAAGLVHALQNHDELTYELVHFWTIHKDDSYRYKNKTIKGLQLRDIVRNDLRQKLTTGGKNYNLLFTDNGIACTTASLLAASQDYTDISNLTTAQVETIMNAHLLLAKFNAWQPGVFALSGWDLAGTLTLQSDQVKDLVTDGDTRWINRGSYDLMGDSPTVIQSSAGMPKAASLYGPLPDQLKNPDSFASQLKLLLAQRERLQLAISRQLDIPQVSHRSALAMLHKLPDERPQITLLNFSNETITTRVTSQFMSSTDKITDFATSTTIAECADHSFEITLGPYEGRLLLVN